MTLTLTSARIAATDGSWMDLPSAAAYAGVAIAVLARAIQHGELESEISGGRIPMMLLHSHDVEAWAAEREAAAASLAS